MDWLASMLKLLKPFMFSGTGSKVIQNTLSEAILVTLVSARDRVLCAKGTDDAIQKLVVYCSDQNCCCKTSRFSKSPINSGMAP
jgi:aromatic-L-amino-acid decarboxylase